MEDIVIIGSGPAGISAALYAVRGNLSPLVLTNGVGALEKAERIQNYYGNKEFLTGQELHENGMEQARKMECVSRRRKYWECMRKKIL